jgi:hypothetical protein
MPTYNVRIETDVAAWAYVKVDAENEEQAEEKVEEQLGSREIDVDDLEWEKGEIHRDDHFDVTDVDLEELEDA